MLEHEKATFIESARSAPRQSVGIIYLLLSALPVLSVVSARLAGFIALGLGLVLFLLRFPHERRLLKNLSPVMGWIFFLIFLSTASAVWALDPSTTLNRALETAPLLLAGGGLVCLLPEIALRLDYRKLWILPAGYALAWIVLGSELIDGMALLRVIHQGEAVKIDMLNRSTLFCTLLYSPIIKILWSLPGLQSNRKFLLSVSMTIVIGAVLAGSASQSAQLAFLLYLIVIIAYPYRWKAAAWITAGSISLLIIATPWLTQYMFHHFAVPLSGSGSAEIHQAYMPDRMEIWDFVSRYALGNPLLGFGMDATRSVPAFDTQELFQKGRTAFHPHNFAVQLWMEFGLVGALYSACLLSRIVLAIRRQPENQQRVCMPAFVACLSAAAMTFSLWQGWWLGTLFFVFAMSRFAINLKQNPRLSRLGEVGR